MFRYLLLALCATLLAGCDQQPQDQLASPSKSTQTQALPAIVVEPVRLLQEPIETILVETATGALTSWRQFSNLKPTLLLLSNNPFLVPIPDALQAQALELSQKGTPEEITALSVNISASPILLHNMALSAALDANFFSRVIWVLPTPSENLTQAFALFKKQLFAADYTTHEETEGFTLGADSFSGEIRGIPFKVVTGTESLTVNEPAVVHFDLSFFAPLYIDEVKTPLYPLLATQLGNLKKSNIPALAVTLSSSNLGGEIPLAVRFLGQDLRKLIAEPTLLNTPLSKFWFHRQQSLFLPNFFRNDDALKHLLSMEEIDLSDPSVKFALYSIYRELKKGDEALSLLEKAVSLDSIYALEYQQLSNVAVKKGQPFAALNMLAKAAVAFPDNPLIQLSEADIQLKLGHRAKVLELLKELKYLPWSDIYDSEMPNLLKEMEKAAYLLPEPESN